jgi:pimeloyl-ACP methyl ester carboxylesterase
MSATDPTELMSAEQVARLPSGIELCYQTFGDPSGAPLLLIMGLGGPMTWWDPRLCALLAERGFFVIRFDNRDVGRSSRVRGRVSRQVVVRSLLGMRVPAPYTMTDLADDAFGLLDHLDIDAAHVAGVSMGGMIAQTMAIARPERVSSLTSIMSTTGNRLVGWQDPRLLPLMLARRGRSREAYVESAARLWKLIGSPLYPDTPDSIRERAGETWDRGVSAAAVARQMLAVLTQPDRSRDLANVRVPTLVAHGTSDKMVHVSGGRATSRAVPGSELLLVPGMGHDIPVALHATFADAIERVASRRAPRPA